MSFGPVLLGEGGHLVEVEALVAVGDPVGDEVVEAAADVDRRPVGEVPALIQAHAENGVAGLQHGQVGGQVGVGAGVRLHVGVFGPEELAGPAPGQVLDLVDDAVAAVVALAGVALRVLVGEHRTGRGHHRSGGEILGRDELQGGVLPLLLAPDDVEELAVLGHVSSLGPGWLAHWRRVASPGAGSASPSCWTLRSPTRSTVCAEPLGDPSLGRIPPHLTLVPPVNVRADQLAAALARLRAAAAGQPGPLRLTLGPPATFLPDNPVLYLEVGGDLRARCGLCATRSSRRPCERPLSWPWVPHVTVADSAERGSHRRGRGRPGPLRRGRARSIASSCSRRRRGPGLAPLADAALGPAAVVGPGRPGACEITRGRILDPEVRQMLDEAGAASARAGRGDCPTAGSAFFPDRPDRPPRRPSGRRRRRPGGPTMAVTWPCCVAPGVRRQGIGGTLLAHLESAVGGRRLGLPGACTPTGRPGSTGPAAVAYSNATEA